jgi:hypothetical protein
MGTERAIRWRVRGIGKDWTPGCFLCPLSEAGPLYHNIAAFVATREDGERIVRWFGHGARLDYRPAEPQWIQVKVGACDRHLPELRELAVQWFVGAEEIHALLGPEGRAWSDGNGVGEEYDAAIGVGQALARVGAGLAGAPAMESPE